MITIAVALIGLLVLMLRRRITRCSLHATRPKIIFNNYQVAHRSAPLHEGITWHAQGECSTLGDAKIA